MRFGRNVFTVIYAAAWTRFVCSSPTLFTNVCVQKSSKVSKCHHEVSTMLFFSLQSYFSEFCEFSFVFFSSTILYLPVPTGSDNNFVFIICYFEECELLKSRRTSDSFKLPTSIHFIFECLIVKWRHRYYLNLRLFCYFMSFWYVKLSSLNFSIYFLVAVCPRSDRFLTLFFFKFGVRREFNIHLPNLNSNINQLIVRNCAQICVFVINCAWWTSGLRFIMRTWWRNDTI